VPGQTSQESARLLALGVSHHHAPLEVRERLYLQDGHAAELAEALGEAVVLSTCNRTEIYLLGGDPDRARDELEERSGLELDGVLAAGTTVRRSPTCFALLLASTRSSPVNRRSSGRCATRTSRHAHAGPPARC
jgi:hypothetical protein